jgi:hypothetical protein
MSLIDKTFATKLVLKTADQYELWKARIEAVCWTYCHTNIFEVTNKAAYDALESKDSKEIEWVGKCWLTIVGSLDSDLFQKLMHVRKGEFQTLFAEISSALLINMAEDAQQLHVELYTATMVKDCGGDLQAR